MRRSAPSSPFSRASLRQVARWAIGADAFDNAAVGALLAAKNRGRDMPVGVLVGSWNTIDGLVSRVSDAARELKFELAGRLRDEIADLKRELRGIKDTGN